MLFLFCFDKAGVNGIINLCASLTFTVYKGRFGMLHLQILVGTLYPFCQSEPLSCIGWMLFPLSLF